MNQIRTVQQTLKAAKLALAISFLAYPEHTFRLLGKVHPGIYYECERGMGSS